MKKRATREEKRISAPRTDPYDVVHFLRRQGHTFASISRDVPIWIENDREKIPLTGLELKEWYEKEAARRRKKKGSDSR
jgi:hypothetical protein